MISISATLSLSDYHTTLLILRQGWRLGGIYLVEAGCALRSRGEDMASNEEVAMCKLLADRSMAEKRDRRLARLRGLLYLSIQWSSAYSLDHLPLVPRPCIVDF